MTTADLLARIECVAGQINYEQFRTWVVTQAVRNALETFHGSRAFDPDNPGSGEGFISDDQMRVLNITVRRAVHEALGQVDIARRAVQQSRRRELRTEEQEALGFCEFQLSTVATIWNRRLARAGEGVPALRQRARRQPMTANATRICPSYRYPWPILTIGS